MDVRGNNAEDERGNNTCLTIYILIGIAVIALIVTIILGVTLTTRSSPSGPTPFRTSASTPAPTLAPTLAPTTPAPTLAPTETSAPTATPLRRDFMISVIQSRSASTTFSNSTSPQNQALDWILSDTYSYDGLSDDRLVQRFALATLYYSTDGGNWDHGGWLESINECDWNSQDFNLCSQESAVQELYLSQDNLSGRIPIEIVLLTQLNALTLWNNQLTGSIPSELALMTQLTTLDLFNNQMTGSIPSELALLTKLTRLDLSNNQLTGSIPSELALLTKLTDLILHNNELTGSIPSSLCSPGVFIYIDCGEIACTCYFSGITLTNCPSG